MSSIRLNGLTISLSGKTIFDNINLNIEPGKYIIRGRNGVGKSTLLNVLCGLAFPKAGSVTIEGGAELVSDQIAIPPKMTVFSVLRLYDKYERCNKNLRDCLIEKFYFQEHVEKNIGSLSQGSLQKLKIILAVSGHGRWLLLDEAFNGLDDAAVKVLNSIIEESDRPVLLVDHANSCSFDELIKINIHNARICIEQ